MGKIHFTYHDISNSWQIGLNTISIQAFQLHINEFLKFKNSNIDFSLKLTFDDGYESVYLNAFPILKKTNIKAIVFPVIDYIGKYNDWDINFLINRKLHLKKEQLIELSKDGWEIGSHSNNHQALSSISDIKLYNSLKTSKEKLENIINKEVISLRPPFDKINQQVLDISKDIGFKNIYVFKNIKKYNYSNLNLIITHPVYSIDTIQSIYKKLNNDFSEDIKEKFIHFFSNLTILTKKYMFK